MNKAGPVGKVVCRFAAVKYRDTVAECDQPPGDMGADESWAVDDQGVQPENPSSDRVYRFPRREVSFSPSLNGIRSFVEHDRMITL